jgi:hypothetical protein
VTSWDDVHLESVRVIVLHAVDWAKFARNEWPCPKVNRILQKNETGTGYGKIVGKCISVQRKMPPRVQREVFIMFPESECRVEALKAW